MPYQPNQLEPELMSISALLSFDGTISASRKQMAGNALSQTLVISNPSERYIQSGVENEFGKYTFNVKVKEDCVVIRTIERYPRTVNADSIQENPELVVIYENQKTKKVGCMILGRHFSQHPHFGFRYKVKDQPNCPKGWDGLKARLQPGVPLAEGEVLMDSPAINENGGYMFGRECEVAFMTHPAVAEDGILISEELLEQFKFVTYETRIVDFGSKAFPINLYGTDDDYRPFPEIGQYVREDGMLGCLRPYDDNLSPTAMSKKGTRAENIDYTFDERIYVPAGRGRVVDIKVMHDQSSVMPCTPPEMIKQVTKYDLATKRFYEEILKVYRRLEARPEKVDLEPEFHRLVVEALGVCGLGKAIIRNGRAINDSLIKQYRKAPLDDWRLVFVVEYENTPREGNKFTCLHGGKGVVCKTLPRSKMPRDEAGNVADLVWHPGATFNRMNLGRFYEQYVNASSRDFLKSFADAFGIQQGVECLKAVQLVKQTMPDLFDSWYTRLVRHYEIINPAMPAPFVSGRIDPVKHVAHIFQHKIHLHFPTNNDRQVVEMVQMLKAEFPAVRGSVTYTGNSGRVVKTKKPVLIGSVYITLLEKTGDDWTSVSSGKWQNFGVLAHLSKQDKHSTPIRNQPIRAFGETEIRIISSYLGGLAAAELLDRNGNITTHREMVRVLLSADNPSSIPEIVNRENFPLGMARAIQFVKHLALCGGWSFVYRPHSESGEPDPTGIAAYLPAVEKG